MTAGVKPKEFTIIDLFQVSPIGKAKHFQQLMVPGFIEKHPEICQVFDERLLLQVQMAVEVSSVISCSILIRDMETNPNCHLVAHGD
jgi:hypothetical protein